MLNIIFSLNKMKDYRLDISTYLSRHKRTIDLLCVEDINALMNVLVNARDNKKTIFIMGNGGSGATASHFTGDFNKGASFNKDKKFRFVCLNDNIPTMMAYANDLSYDEIFLGPLRNFMEPGDVVIGISGSGNSANVVKALVWANENGGISVGLTGYSGGKVKKISQYNVHIPIDDMQITEDLHMMLDHCMMQIICEQE